MMEMRRAMLKSIRLKFRIIRFRVGLLKSLEEMVIILRVFSGFLKPREALTLGMQINEWYDEIDRKGWFVCSVVEAPQMS